MAESLVGKIVGNAGKQWSRNTVADGNWLNSNTVQKFNENDKTLAEAIESVSAAMEHFTPEITPSAWSCEPNQTIQTIEQNADGSLNVTYQSIETETTSDDSIWVAFQQADYETPAATITELSSTFSKVPNSGTLSDNTTIKSGIFDIKIEVLYKPSTSSLNNNLNLVVSKSSSVDDALFSTTVLFDDTLDDDDVQTAWVTGVISLATETTLHFLVGAESHQGQVKLNKVYVNSIVGVKGDKGDPGTPGAPGVSPTVAITPTTTGQHIVITDAQGDHPFDISNGESGEDGKTPLLQIDATNAHWQYRYSASETWQDIPNTPAASGTKGDNGISPKVRINDETNYWEISEDGGTTWDPTNVSATGAPGRNGISPTVSTEQITGGNRVTFTYDDGGAPATEFIDVMSGTPGTPGHTPVISMTSTDISRQSQGQTQNGTEVKFTIDGTDTTYSAWNGLNGAGSMSQVYTAGYVEGTGVDQQNAVQLTQEAVEAIEAVSGKVNNPNTSLTDKYLGLRTNLDGTVSGWCDLTDKFYSRTSSDDRYIQQTYIDNTLSGTGANAGNKLGVNTEVIPTMDWLDDNYLPLSGGTVSGQLIVSGNNEFDNYNLKFICENQINVGRIGLNNSGGLSIKSSDANNNNYTQINISPTGDNDKRIALQKNVNGTTSNIGYLIPADINTSVPAGGFSNDGILHIVVES